MNEWPFADEKSVAVITSIKILKSEDWVHYVTHDFEDGSWQFHPYSGPTNEHEAVILSLEEMTKIEPRILDLANLQLGWHAWRETELGPWILSPIQ